MKSFKTAKGTELPILNLKGKDYLQVAHRLVWFREERPAWSIETTLETVSDKNALARAVIKDETGRVIATGHKSETIQGFPDFIEKSETGAIGRALALCGYGTQFCADELDEGARLADSPVIRTGSSSVHPGQPEPGDGMDSIAYKINFGKWTGRTIEEVHRNQGTDAIWSYIEYINNSAKKKSVPVSGAAAEFVARASEFLAAIGPNG